MLHMRKFELVSDEFRKHPSQTIRLPKRKTKYSAGYDFHAPVDISILPDATYMVWTDICCSLEPTDFLSMHIRSSFGNNKSLRIKNLVGIIDKDFHRNISNGGNIGICLINESPITVTIKKDEAFCQGIISTYIITDDDDADAERIGGIGSTSI